jgi:hypothetical protein
MTVSPSATRRWGDVPAYAVAALDRPNPVGVLSSGGEHGFVAVTIGAEAAQKAFTGTEDSSARRRS